MSGPSLFDRLSLWILKLAKRQRTRASQSDFYESFFDDYHFEQFQEDIRHILKHRELKRAIGELPESAVCLDLGCGVGHTLKLFPPHARRIGMDYSSRSIEIARKWLGEGYEFLQGSADSIPLPDSSVDLLTCLEVLEHLQNDADALKEISRVLKPGGRLIMSVPGNYYFPEYYELIGHIRHYNRSGLEAMLQQSGLKINEGLHEFPVTNRLYYLVYVLLEGMNRFLRLLSGSKTSIYKRKLPFTKAVCYGSIVRPFFLWIGGLEWAHLRRSLGSSTFFIAVNL